MNRVSGASKIPAAAVKNMIRRQISRRGLELVANPFDDRVAKLLAHRRLDTVIDGGANVGQSGIALRAAAYQGRILSAEPLSAAFAQLSQAAAADALWSVHRLAFSDSPGEIDLNVSANSVSSSPLPMLDAHSNVDPESVYVGSESAPTTTVDLFVEQHGINPESTLLKLDVQGYENVVFAGAASTIGQFAAVQVELSYVPLYDGQWLADQTTEFLKQHGYDFWMYSSAAMYDPRSQRLLQCDGVFVRP